MIVFKKLILTVLCTAVLLSLFCTELGFVPKAEASAKFIDGYYCMTVNDYDYFYGSAAYSDNVTDVNYTISDPSVIEVVGKSGRGVNVHARRTGTSVLTIAVTSCLQGHTNINYWNFAKSYIVQNTPSDVQTTYSTFRIKVTKDGVAFTSKKKRARVKVIKPKSISLSSYSLTLNKGKKTKLTATVYPTNAKGKKIYWKSSNSSVAVVSKKGVVKAKRKGNVKITAKTSNGVKATCRIKVVIIPKKVKLNRRSISLKVNNSCKLKAKISPKGSVKGITWSSSDDSVASVTSKGRVKAVSKGKAVITAVAYGGKKAACKVNCILPVKKVSVSKKSAELAKGNTLSLKASVTPSDASARKIFWSSSDESVATVDKGKVYAKKKGNVTITARTANGKSASCNVRVYVAATGIKLDETSLVIDYNSSQKLGFSLLPEGSEGEVKWKSSDNENVAVDFDGTITALKPGRSAEIKAKLKNGKSDTCTVYVKDIATTGLGFDFDSRIINLYDSDETIYFGNKRGSCFDLEKYNLLPVRTPFNSTDEMTYTSSNPDVAEVRNSDLVAYDLGKATITATAPGGASASFDVEIQRYWYHENDTGVTLTQYDVLGDTIEIPAYIYGKKVTKLSKCLATWRREENSKYYHKKIIVPDTVTEIDEGTFAGQTELEEIKLSSSLETIVDDGYDVGAFYNCKSLKKLDLPDSLKYIGKNAFENCAALESVEIGDNIEYLGDNAFNGCKSLKKAVIGRKINEIPCGAFSNCSLAEGIIFKGEIKKICDSAFKGCGFSHFEIPDSVREIEGWAFENCNELTEITIPKVESLGQFSFSFCEKLKKAVVLCGWINSDVFKNDTALEEVYVADNPDASYSFISGLSGCTSLKALYLPKRISKIYASNIPENLKYIYYSGSEEDWSKVKITKSSLPEKTKVIYNAVY